MKPETRAIHSGQRIDPTSGATTLPIQPGTTFERAPDGSYPHGYVYSRLENPNREVLEEALCTLEDGQVAAAFGSGSAAALTVLQALKTGDHVIAPQDMYYGFRQLLTDVFGPWGLAVDFVDMRQPQALKAALRDETRLVMVESPSNPLLHITDIQGVCEIAHAAGALVMVDNTIATPAFQQPLALGADLVLEATTKYLNGHHDVLGGAIIARQNTPFFERVRMIQRRGGAVPSAFDCWLTMRGLQTFPHRMRLHAENAQTVARFLAEHPQVEQVLYPGLPTHPAHALASQQMSGYGGLLSFMVQGDEAAALRLAAHLRLIKRATSFGGPQTQVEHRASIEHEGTTTPRNLLRLAVGLEHPDDLLADLEQAFAQLAGASPS